MNDNDREQLTRETGLELPWPDIDTRQDTSADQRTHKRRKRYAEAGPKVYTVARLVDTLYP